MSKLSPHPRFPAMRGRRMKQMVLEGLCDFMSEPTFLVELYVNYDCDLQVSLALDVVLRELPKKREVGVSGREKSCAGCNAHVPDTCIV